MAVTRLLLTDFRSYREAAIHAGPGLVVLTGENGAGKTNVLEAISLLAPGRGLRGASLAEMARRDGPGGFAVAAVLAPPLDGEGLGRGEPSMLARAEPFTPTQPSPIKGEGEATLGTGTLAAAPERRLVRVNGAPASANALSEWLAVLWLTPAMDRLFTDSAGNRRRFLDRLVLALRPGHAGHSARYEAAMRARNKLLAEPEPDSAWLAALEARMAEHGAAVAAARRETVTALAERLGSSPDGAFPRADLMLSEAEPEDLAAALAAHRARDAAAGRTLLGPHRTDLAVTHAGKGMPAASCSTGEQKALLIALILAHSDLVAARAGRRPILLLDEIAAHLDPVRRAALFDRLATAGGQVWMTGTEPSLFSALGSVAYRLEVANGAVTRSSVR